MKNMNFERLKDVAYPLLAVGGVIGSLFFGTKGVNMLEDYIENTDPIRIPRTARVVKTVEEGKLAWLVDSAFEANASDCGGTTRKFLPDIPSEQNRKVTARLPGGQALVVCELAQIDTDSDASTIEYPDPEIEYFTPQGGNIGSPA